MNGDIEMLLKILEHVEKLVPIIVALLAAYLALVVSPVKGAVKELKEILANYQEWRGKVSQSLEDNASDHREMKDGIVGIHKRLDKHIEGSK